MSAACGSGTYQVGTACVPYTFTPAGAVPAATAQTLQQAVTALPATELAKPLNPQLVAATANALWQQAAAQPGYAGLPYPAANPISTAEAQKWMQANPGVWPTVGDFVTPKPTNATSTQPWALPSDPTAATSPLTTAANPTATNPASANPMANLGPDPATPAPTLENIPTAQQIVGPIVEALPGHRTFSVSGQAGECPRGQFDLWGSTYHLDAHCTLIDQNKATLRAASVLGWTIVALLIVLSA